MSKYKCYDCGVSGVKLWIWYSPFFHEDGVLCVDCRCAKPSCKVHPLTVREDGSRTYYRQWYPKKNIGHAIETHQLDGYMPLIEMLDGSGGIWAYTALREENMDAFEAWKALPLRTPEKQYEVTH